MERPEYIIGIDPDVEKSGIAVLDTRNRELALCTSLPFAEVLRWFRQAVTWPSVRVVMEDSDMSVNWHYAAKDRPAVTAAKGRSVGMCHATARHLKECAEDMGLEVVMQPPLRKIWQGRDGKMTHEEAAVFMRGLPQRTNQEARDAALLAWNHAGFPIRIKPKKI